MKKKNKLRAKIIKINKQQKHQNNNQTLTTTKKWYLFKNNNNNNIKTLKDKKILIKKQL